jgi:hypothetical protein
MGNKQVKQETRVAKVGTKKVTAVRRQLADSSVAGQGTMEMPTKSPSSTSARLDGEQTRVTGSRLTATKTYVPVLSVDREVLMPTTPARARKWIKSGKANPFFRGQMFCVRMNVVTGKKVQPIAVGIDPGSKWEGYTVKSEAHTYLNIQADAVTWVKDAISTRRMMRKTRRSRKTPYRKQRSRRKHAGLTPATKARWQWKLRVASWLCKLFPVDCFVVEDIKAPVKGKRNWDVIFGSLQVGKSWFYFELKKLAKIETLQGYETFALREQYKLKKSSDKKKPVFSAHCVDSWVLANYYVGGHIVPDNETLMQIIPLQFHRRRLHLLQPTVGGKRRRNGGTRSLGLKRGSIVLDQKYGKTYVGGTQRGKISLHCLDTGKRLTECAIPLSCKFLAYSSWRAIKPLSV